MGAVALRPSHSKLRDSATIWLLNAYFKDRLIVNYVALWPAHKGIKSDSINLNIGVKQGDIASSLLSYFFLNNITQHINTIVFCIYICLSSHITRPRPGHKYRYRRNHAIRRTLYYKFVFIVLWRRRGPFCAKSPLITIHVIWRQNLL